jgi:hypothetical protein
MFTYALGIHKLLPKTILIANVDVILVRKAWTLALGFSITFKYKLDNGFLICSIKVNKYAWNLFF